MPHHEHCKILIVDDDPFILIDSVDLAEQAGCEALQAANADEALRVLERHDDVTIILTDVDMPRGSMNGLALARIVCGRWPAIRIIVMSGHQSVAESDLPARGMFLRKPYAADRLVQTLRTLAA